MKKRILLLSSSPRRHGNSDRLCDEFLRGAREAGHDAEKISLRDCRIGYCTGCGVCYDTRTCPQRDDAAQIVGKMIAADVIVLATPVYFYTMSAQMKTLIDRCCARYTEMTGKEFYFIVAAADDSKAAMERTIDGFRGFLDCLDDSRECGTIYGVGAWKIGEIEGSPAMKQAYDAGFHCCMVWVLSFVAFDYRAERLSPLRAVCDAEKLRTPLRLVFGGARRNDGLRRLFPTEGFQMSGDACGIRRASER